MKQLRVIGIDPGLSGGIAVKDYQHPVKVYKMPRGVEAMKRFFTELQTGKDVIFLEKVMVMRNDQMEPGKAFGIEKMLRGYNEMRTVLLMLGFLLIDVYPVSWQSYLHTRIKGKKEAKKDRKNRYKRIAQERYPEVKATLWNSDALLILEYGRKKLKYEPEAIKMAAIKSHQLQKWEQLQLRIYGNDYTLRNE